MDKATAGNRIAGVTKEVTGVLLAQPFGSLTAAGGMCATLLYAIAIGMSDEQITKQFKDLLRTCRKSDEEAQQQEKAVQ